MNTSHIHKLDVNDPKSEIEAQGERDDCDLCRERNGLKPKSEIEASLEKRAKSRKPGDTRQPVEHILEQLEESEQLNDELRDKVKQLELEKAQLETENEGLKKKLAKKQGD